MYVSQGAVRLQVLAPDWFDCDSDVIVRLKSPRNKIGAPDQLYSDLNLQPNDLLLEVIF